MPEAPDSTIGIVYNIMMEAGAIDRLIFPRDEKYVSNVLHNLIQHLVRVWMDQGQVLNSGAGSSEVEEDGADQCAFSLCKPRAVDWVSDPGVGNVWVGEVG